MLAVLYLILLLLLGDALCRRFFKFASGPHRFGAAFLTGALIGSWWTYLSAFVFAWTNTPLLWGNLLFFVMCLGLIYWLWANPASQEFQTRIDSDQVGFNRWDWVAAGMFLAYACWLTFATFSMQDGKVLIATHQWSDFGSTVSIMQSFANGHNFPTEYPHFSGDRIRYHFLFYFLAGNLEYLGLSPATANNLLSILSLMSMLFVVMALGVVLFNSRLIGRIAACLFFFHGTLSFILFAQKHWPLSNVIDQLWKTRDFLPSGFNYRGELWGVWSQVVYANQRHLASSIGILLLVMFFLIDRYREAERQKRALRAAAEPAQAEIDDAGADEAGEPAEPAPPEEAAAADSDAAVADGDAAVPESASAETEPAEPAAALADSEPPAEPNAEEIPPDAEASVTDEPGSPAFETKPTPAAPKEINYAELVRKLYTGLGRVSPFIFAGVLLGLLPMWNGAVFTAAFAILAMFFVLFPYRRQMVILGVTTAVVALPQVIYLRGGNVAPSGSVLNWGYTLGEPSLFEVAYYLGWTFGVKWLLIIIAVVVGTWLSNRVFIAMFSMFVVTFCLVFSPEALTNHKFLNIWLVVANIYAAAGIWWLWSFRGIGTTIPGRLLAIVLTATIVVGGLMDLFPIKNSNWMYMDYRDDALVQWVLAETDPNAVFVTNRVVNHPILLAGRRLFNGHTYYAWSAGYATGPRDMIYKRIYESRDPQEVFRLLKENNISYVAFDNAIRKGDFIRNHNEDLYKAYFETVFEDPVKYDAIRIFAVPAQLDPPRDPELARAVAAPSPSPSAAVNAFVGGEGAGFGQFSRPRGVAVDSKGNIYVADTGNSRIQKFNLDGTFLMSFGRPGTAEGEIKEPNGIAVDEGGRMFITDAFNSKLILLDPNGIAIKEWKGPEPGFYGPRDIVYAPNKKLYIVDQGRTRIVRFDPVTESFTSWGSSGSGDGQFSESTGIGAGDGMIFVADNANNRVQVFDLDGGFIRQWVVPAWERYVWNFPDVAYSPGNKRVYVSNPWKDEILVYDVMGNQAPEQRIAMRNPTSIVLFENKGNQKLIAAGTNLSVLGQYLMAR